METHLTVSEKEESVVDVEGFKGKGNWINRMTRGGDGNIVISGRASDEHSHITVINRKGEIQRRDRITREKKHRVFPYRYCCYFTERKIVTACAPDEIGIYDVLNGAYKKTNISGVISYWPPDRSVWCVATGTIHNRIFVGTNSKYVYVFDEQLNFSSTITLPDVISRSRDITVHGDSLLICDYSSRRACAITMEGSESKLIYEFTNPDIDGGNWGAHSVSKDKNYFIYMLWSAYISGQWRCILVQYSQDGRQLLSTREVDHNAWSVATLELDKSDKVLITTAMGKLYEYGLKVNLTNRLTVSSEQ